MGLFKQCKIKTISEMKLSSKSPHCWIFSKNTAHTLYGTLVVPYWKTWWILHWQLPTWLNECPTNILVIFSGGNESLTNGLLCIYMKKYSCTVWFFFHFHFISVFKQILIKLELSPMLRIYLYFSKGTPEKCSQRWRYQNLGNFLSYFRHC